MTEETFSESHNFEQAIKFLEEFQAWERSAERAERWRNTGPEMQPLYDLLKEVGVFLKKVKDEAKYNPLTEREERFIESIKAVKNWLRHRERTSNNTDESIFKLNADELSLAMEQFMRGTK